MKEDEVKALFTLAGFGVGKVYELANMYWGGSAGVARWDGGISPTGPWWLLMTEAGPIRIGRRKRVIEIEWDQTSIRKVVTEDEVTKHDTLVHAWSTEKALEYLKALWVAWMVAEASPKTSNEESKERPSK